MLDLDHVWWREQSPSHFLRMLPSRIRQPAPGPIVPRSAYSSFLLDALGFSAALIDAASVCGLVVLPTESEAGGGQHGGVATRRVTRTH